MTNSTKEKKTILFVCDGNTCRSPMLEYLTRDYAQKHKLRWEAISRGLMAIPSIFSMGMGATKPVPKWRSEGSMYGGMMPEALRSLAEIGIDATGHRPSQLMLDDILRADMVVTVGKVQKDDILTFQTKNNLSPDFFRNTYTLTEIIGYDKASEIPDPAIETIASHVQWNKDVYDKCRDTIKACVEALGNVVQGKKPNLKKVDAAFNAYSPYILPRPPQWGGAGHLRPITPAGQGGYEDNDWSWIKWWDDDDGGRNKQ